MTDRIALDDMTSDQLDQLYDQLDALRAVARGYCPACGRGDAAPTVEDWEQQKQRADRAEAEIAACRRQQWPQQLARTAEALRQALDCIIYGNGQPRDPDDLARWRAALNLQEQPHV